MQTSKLGQLITEAVELLILLLFVCAVARAQTTSTLTGTIRGLDQSLVTTGKVTFTATPGADATISGFARFSNQVVTCTINQASVGAAAAVRAINVVTISGLTGHTFLAGDIVTVSGMTDTSFNGTFTVSAVTATTINYPQVAGNATTGSGVVAALRGGAPNGTTAGSCVVTQNTALTPFGSSYLATIYPYGVKGPQFRFYATSAAIDLTTIVPTPLTVPSYSFVDTFSNQTIGGSKTFTGTVNFTAASLNLTGPFISNAANPASIGFLRLATGDVIAWRNAANNGNVQLLHITIGGVDVISGTAPYSGTFQGTASLAATTGILNTAFLNSPSVCTRNTGNTADICMGLDASDRMTFPQISLTKGLLNFIPNGNCSTLSAAGQGSLCYDNALQAFRQSVNGGAYGALAGGNGYAAIQNNTAGVVARGILNWLPTAPIVCVDNAGATRTDCGSQAYTSPTANPAAAGMIKLSKTDAINFRNNSNSADINGVSLDTSDRLKLGGTNGIILQGPITSPTANPAGAGSFARLAAADTLYFRNAVNNADLLALSKTSNDRVQVGSPTMGASIPSFIEFPAAGTLPAQGNARFDENSTVVFNNPGLANAAIMGFAQGSVQSTCQLCLNLYDTLGGGYAFFAGAFVIGGGATVPAKALLSTNNAGNALIELVYPDGSDAVHVGNHVPVKDVYLEGDVTLGNGANAGVFNDSGGFKHKRVTTGSIAATTDAAVTVSWGTVFADTNYTATCSVVDSTASNLSLKVTHIDSIAVGSMSVRVRNDSAGALTGTLHCMAVHD